MKRPLSVALALVTLFACDEPDDSVQFLTIENGQAYQQSGEHWIFATDDNGKLLDIRSIDGTDWIELRSTQNNLTHVDLTLATVSPMPEGKSISLETFTRVPTGKTLKLHQLSPAFVITDSKEYEVRITKDNNAVYAPQVSVLPQSYNPFDQVTSTETEYIFKGYIPASAEQIIVTAHLNGSPVYWKGTPHPAPLKLNIDDFIKQEAIVTVPEQVRMAVYGLETFENRNRALLSEIRPDELIAAKQIGYVPGFPNYLSELSMSGTTDSKMHAWRMKYGAPLAEASFTMPEIKIIDNSLENFEFSSTNNFHYQTVIYHSSLRRNDLRWAVHTDASTSPALKWDFPAEFTKHGAWVRKDNLKSLYLQIIDGHETSTYGDFLQERLFNEFKTFDRTTYFKWLI